MTIIVDFDSVSHRREIRQYIQEAGKEIQENTELLQALFILDNGINKHSNHGFGYTELNESESTTVSYEMNVDKFENIINQLKVSSPDDLGEEYKEQLQTLTNNLSIVAKKLEEYYTT